MCRMRETPCRREPSTFVIGRLIADEDLRVQFAVDPLGTLAAWLNAGPELTGADTSMP